MQKTKARRDNSVDTAKGLAIILMCVGHAYCAPLLGRFIYLFHMAFFLMMSGYFFSDKNLDDLKGFVIKRLKGLWLPFVVAGWIFILLHNVLLDLQLSSPPPYEYYDLKSMAYKIFTTIPRFIPTEDMMGPYWFLSCLFGASLVAWAFFWLGRRAGRGRVVVITTLFTASYAVSCAIASGCVGDKFGVRLPLTGAALLFLGYTWRRNAEKIKYTLWGVVLSALVLLVAALLGRHVAIPTGDYDTPLTFIVYSVAGCYMLLGASHYINKCVPLERVMSYIGRHTIIILLLNVLCNRIFYVIKSYAENFDGHPTDVVADGNNWYYCTLQTIFAVALPLALDWAWRATKERLR